MKIGRVILNQVTVGEYSISYCVIWKNVAVLSTLQKGKSLKFMCLENMK